MLQNNAKIVNRRMKENFNYKTSYFLQITRFYHDYRKVWTERRFAAWLINMHQVFIMIFLQCFTKIRSILD